MYGYFYELMAKVGIVCTIALAATLGYEVGKEVAKDEEETK